jgi:hypothetical protein
MQSDIFPFAANALREMPKNVVGDRPAAAAPIRNFRLVAMGILGFFHMD